jgi:hypothetical protein
MFPGSLCGPISIRNAALAWGNFKPESAGREADKDAIRLVRWSITLVVNHGRLDFDYARSAPERLRERFSSSYRETPPDKPVASFSLWQNVRH